MKKFIFMIVAIITATLSANAQSLKPSTVVGSGLLDNWSVSLNASGLTPLDGDGAFFGRVRPTVGVELTKFVTPTVGFGLEGRFATNTTASKTAIDASNVSGLVKLNLSNLFGGYIGEPRTVEFVAVTGIGWGHAYVNHALGKDDNFVTTKTGAEINVNLGKAKAWQLNLKPAVVWADVPSHPFNSNRAALEVSVGVTYKFKNKNTKTHNFAVFTPTVIEKEIVREVPVEKTVEVVKEVKVENTTVTTIEKTHVVTFAKGKSVLTDDAIAALNAIPTDSTVKIVASASPEGGKAFNQKLSEARANAVKEHLTARGVKVATADGLGVTGPTSNRVAIVTIQ